MTEFYLITGFLGSGKTTLLKKILDEYKGKERIAIIQNEFAPSGVDGKELINTGKEFKLVEINNGSVFCVCMLGNFIDKLNQLIEKYQPGIIFLEASGLADPVNILELLQSGSLKEKLLLAGIISIVDVVNFEKGYNLLTRFRHQIMIADTIILNKMDLFEGEPEDISERIKQINPFAVIKLSSYCDLNMDSILASGNKDHTGASNFLGVSSEDRPDINTLVLRSSKTVPRINFDPFIKEVQRISYRMKGYINLEEGGTMAVHTVFEQDQSEKIDNYTGPTEMIVFSEKLDLKGLGHIFKKYQDI